MQKYWFPWEKRWQKSVKWFFWTCSNHSSKYTDC